MKKKILIVEDDPDIASTVEYNLQKEGYDAMIVANGLEVAQAVKSFKPDLILLDIMLPGQDGFEVCRQLKSSEKMARIPIIMLTVKSSDVDVVLGLELGADDYVIKPFSVRVLLARIKNILMRDKKRDTPPAHVRYYSLTIDRDTREACVGKQRIHFSKTEFDILNLLVSKPGRVFSRNQILDYCWPDGVFVVDRTVDVHINSIRKKLGALGDNVESIRGIGYRVKE
jgi:DNA-binding response OmpR family regulator